MINYGGKILHNLIKLVLNATCQLGNFPSAWKFDDIIYLKKQLKSHTMIQSHIARSVSLTNTLVKISERILLPPLLSGLEENNFYNKNLYAYRKFHTMSHAIILLNEDV